MNLIAQRPNSWTEVIGQQRAIDVLHAVLRNQNFLTRGIILYGPIGVGKTTISYLIARALMCNGSDPLGCGECDSCKTIANDGIDSHPDFIEIDAGQKPGVEAAREVVEQTVSLPSVGKRRVSIIDEAQFLSPDAWGSYLKILEQADTNSIFIFISNEIEKIKRSTTSRCIKIPFERVSNSTMVGLLSKLATANNINYERAALDVIARHSKGIVRDAVQWLNTAAALGDIKPDLIKTVIDTSLEDKCTQLLLTIAAKDQVEACKLADEISLNAHPNHVVEAMLGIYGRSIWKEEGSDLQKIYIGLPNVAAVTNILVKWSALTLPADVLVIIVFELLKTQTVTVQPTRRIISTPINPTAKPMLPSVSRPKISSFLDGEAI